jgi:hypothetical protein
MPGLFRACINDADTIVASGEDPLPAGDERAAPAHDGKGVYDAVSGSIYNGDGAIGCIGDIDFMILRNMSDAARASTDRDYVRLP